MDFNLKNSSLFSHLILHLVVGLSLTGARGSLIGVCYGMLGDNQPQPEEVVSLYKSHHIKKIRLYEPSHSIFQALHHSSIQVLVGVRDDDIKSLAASFHDARQWIRKYVEAYWPSVRFQYIAVGNEEIPGPNAQHVFLAMKNLQNALRKARLWEHIKVSTVIGTSAMGVIYPPSSGAFSNESIEYMKPIIRLLARNDAPLLVNVHPFFNYVMFQERISLGYALFLSKKVILQDGGVGYQNLFDEMLDAFYAALEKVGTSGRLPIVVSETGWPTGRNRSFGSITTHDVARLYNSNLVRHILSSQGTPKRQGTTETYIYAMFQENQKAGATSERYWGLFYPNKQPVYPLKFI